MSHRLLHPLLFGVLVWGVVACTSKDDEPKFGVSSGGRSSSTDIGAVLFTEAPYPKYTDDATSGDPIRISLCHLILLDRVDVPSKEDGTIEFYGVELKPGEKIPGVDHIKHERTLAEVRTDMHFRRLRIGEKVQKGQVIGMLNDKRAVMEVGIAKNNVDGADLDEKAAVKNIEHYKANLDIELDAEKKGASSKLAIVSARANLAKAVNEAASKHWTFIRTKGEEKKALDQLDNHLLRAPIDGEVVQLLKQVGEGVRASEAVLQIQNSRRLSVEGNLPVEYVNRVSIGDGVYLEPSILEPPLAYRSPHASSKPISAVAVANRGGMTVIVSASEDGNVYVWDREKVYATWKHPGGAVRALAVTRPNVKQALALTGCDDGKVRLWSLGDLSTTPVATLETHHEGGVQAAAFSPDGAHCVTADDRGDLHLFDTANGKLRYTFPREHNSSISSVSFTPQGRVISAGRDNLALVWKVGEKSATVENTFDHRSGEVSHLGISDDGGQMLLDLDKNRLRMIDLGTGRNRGTLQQAGDGKFSGFALISPTLNETGDRVLLTAGGTEGVLQLWRWSAGPGRGSELKKLVCSGYVPATCAAFSPAAENGFIVAGTRKGDVHVWQIPATAETVSRYKARITHIDPNLESSGRTVKVFAEFDNPDGPLKLRPGTTTTMVIPQK